MDQARQSSWDESSEIEEDLSAPPPQRPADAHPINVVKLTGASGHFAPSSSGTQPSLSPDPSKLVEHLRSAAQHVRKLEAQAKEQELRIQEMLERIREEIISANERVRAAEDQVEEMRVRADALARDAEERIQAAEVRACMAEEWMSRVQATITREFGMYEAE
ncbi:hypothetical protein [Methylobacterium oxalidis]|uniref:Uncharacterized protein n=1 Tax=Methylobacterium oxalidis TaxID=944322 RepID=A0A512IZC8_9HYPH|nr:hypothetical protein [Methylobacterium oxalidis]GEP03060.1 hypothetical protein MOX02_10980 [Methylobacterium oxalidis]GJE32828.1 hypothetical protein LDDCCGHA_3022 [Methylobacterium oxalidis]GLS67319.1 hypothetical protein GCM10007888_57030 [Methylobacterium oxalidis]